VSKLIYIGLEQFFRVLAAVGLITFILTSSVGAQELPPGVKHVQKRAVAGGGPSLAIPKPILSLRVQFGRYGSEFGGTFVTEAEIAVYPDMNAAMSFDGIDPRGWPIVGTMYPMQISGVSSNLFSADPYSIYFGGFRLSVPALGANVSTHWNPYVCRNPDLQYTRTDEGIKINVRNGTRLHLFLTDDGGVTWSVLAPTEQWEGLYTLGSTRVVELYEAKTRGSRQCANIAQRDEMLNASKHK